MAIATRAGASRMTSALPALETVFSGDLIGPAHPGYEATRRVWNGSIDRHPALIAQCRTAGDVAAALRWARGIGLPVAVRSGGHSFPGLSVCDDGIVIDLRRLNHVAVDPRTGTVRVGAGALLGELDTATQRYRMAVPLGAVSHTGVGGLALGGGIGWLMRHHGLTVDRMRSASVLATDDSLTASVDEQSDLFWAIRGGGGNFGIVTDFTFELRPVGPLVFGGFVYWALEDGHRLARLYRDWSADAPDALTTALVIRRAPAIAMIPSALHGRPVIGVGLCWSGELAAGERFAAPLRRPGAPCSICVPPDRTSRCSHSSTRAIRTASGRIFGRATWRASTTLRSMYSSIRARGSSRPDRPSRSGRPAAPCPGYDPRERPTAVGEAGTS